jgi:hypothetical protein
MDAQAPAAEHQQDVQLQVPLVLADSLGADAPARAPLVGVYPGPGIVLEPGARRLAVLPACHVGSGRPMAREALGMELFDWYAQNPEEAGESGQVRCKTAKAKTEGLHRFRAGDS